MRDRQPKSALSQDVGSDLPKHQPQNRRSADSKLRRGKRHCPNCLTPHAKIASRTRLMRACQNCDAHPSDQKRCSKCHASECIWENSQDAACQACAQHGPKSSVIAIEE